jgi:hypothetical protein
MLAKRIARRARAQIGTLWLWLWLWYRRRWIALEEMSNLSIAHGHRGVLKGGAVSQRELSKQASELPMVCASKVRVHMLTLRGSEALAKARASRHELQVCRIR